MFGRKCCYTNNIIEYERLTLQRCHTKSMLSNDIGAFSLRLQLFVFVVQSVRH